MGVSLDRQCPEVMISLRRPEERREEGDLPKRVELVKYHCANEGKGYSTRLLCKKAAVVD
jgi:hypothetical protein